jgi:4-hydroxyphenylacetate 3-monooxygenase
MGARSGRQYLDSLRDSRQIWIDGEAVADVTKDRRFSAAARSMADLYDMQHDPALRDRLTYTSPTTGDGVGLSSSSRDRSKT